MLIELCILLSVITWIFWSHSGWIASTICSFVLRIQLDIKDVKVVLFGRRSLILNDIRIKLKNGLSVHLDKCIISFGQQVSKPLSVFVGDIRIEADPLIFASGEQKNQKAGSTKNGKADRIFQITQYCSLSVASVHLILLDVLPDCMVHVTFDEIQFETFRSRDSWQIEFFTRLAQGKAMKRRGPTGRPLADMALQCHFSVDLADGVIKKLTSRIVEPAISVSCDIIDILTDLSKNATTTLEASNIVEATATTPDSLFSSYTNVNLSISNCSLKYLATTNGEYSNSRSLCLTVKDTSLDKENGLARISMSALALVDHNLKSTLKSSQLELIVQPLIESTSEIIVNTDSVQTSISVQDVLWWQTHFEGILREIQAKRKTPFQTNILRSPAASKLSVYCSLEVASVTCQLVDADSFQSVVSIKYLTFIQKENIMEFGVESLCIASVGSAMQNSDFTTHRWGQSLYIGVALVEFKNHRTFPKLHICIDECKVEWSDKLAEQVHKILLLIHSHRSTTESIEPSQKSLKVQIKAKRMAVVSIARQATYLSYLCDELELEATQLPYEVVVNTKKNRIGCGTVAGSTLVLDTLWKALRSVPRPDKTAGNDWRFWNQEEKEKYRFERRKEYEEKRNETIKMVFDADILCFSIEHLSPATRDVTISSNSDVYIVWSPLLHRTIYHMKTIIASTLALPRLPGAVRVPPRVLQLKMLTNHAIDLDMELPIYHRMIWRIPSLTFDKPATNLTAISPSLTINMNGFDVVSAVDVCITKRAFDAGLTELRKAFGNLEAVSNKTWTWAAESFVFHLPFEFNFHQVFDEFINCIKWIKIVHETKKKPFTLDSPLPADIRFVFKEVRLEMENDPFENRLQLNHELKEDEVYECERRRQLLAEKLTALKKSNPLFPQSKIDEFYATLTEKNSTLYVERWRNSQFADRLLFTSKWTGFEIRAFADRSLHGTEACIGLMHEFDPLSFFPVDGLQFSTLWARGVEFDITEWTMHFKDYSIPYLLAKDMHFFGTLVGAEQFEEGGRSLREAVVDLPSPWETHTVLRNMSPLKYYYDMQCESSEFNCTYGPCWEPCLSMISLTWNMISAPSKDPSTPLPFWDKMRFLLHGRFSWLSNRYQTTMLASPDPYNATETLEMCWDDFGLDWALGEIRIRSRFKVFMRTASRYDESKILSIPDLKLRISLDWICGGDPHDHHLVTLCAPHRLPHYSTDHDSYRAFRSQCLDLVFSFDVAPGAEGSPAERIPQVMLYANTFRCIEFLINTLTVKNRIIKRGRIFGTPTIMKPQLSKHFRNVQVSVNFPKFFINYRMSHSSDYGFRVSSDGLNLLASMKLSMDLGNDKEITRRRTYSWSPQHVSATLWGAQVHVFGNGSKVREEGEEPGEETLLLSINRVSYVRENQCGKDNAVHKLTAHDLRAAWTAEIRDSCLSIADGVHRAHLLRRILSNDAIKILKLHMEEENGQLIAPSDQTAGKDSEEVSGHRRGYSISDSNQSMLNQLIDESSTKLIAHCEQATDLPTDSLQGVHQCEADDVLLTNWQIDLLNSQVVLKGCERDGFMLVSAARASLTQKIHKCVWRNGQLLGKKSWSAGLSGMQYFAPLAMSSGQNKSQFRWLPRDLIEERLNEPTTADYLSDFISSGEAVGGVVQPDSSLNRERPQLQRIISRCSCQTYFCYFSEELKTDALEETGVPKLVEETGLGQEYVGVDCFTLKHNMIEASTSSDQYEMLVDIANNLVLFIDPKKKELAEYRRRLRFECQLLDINQMRETIVEQQSQLRNIVTVVRSLERQLYFMDAQSDSKAEERREIVEEMEEYKARQLEVSDQLAVYVSCYKQRQVEAARVVVHQVEEDGLAAIARRFEVCFEDCIWRLTENDGQIAIAETQIRNFLYTRVMRIDSSGEHLFEVGSIRMSNLLPDTIYRDTLHRDERMQTRQPAIRLMLRDLAPVGGICVKEHFEVNISPMVAQLTYQFFEKMMLFFFPGRNIHKEDNLDNPTEDGTPKFSFTRRIAGTLSMRSNKSTTVDRKASTVIGGKVSTRSLQESEMDDIEKMRQRADSNNFFLYIKIPEVPFVVSYKGNKDKNIEDVDRFSFLFPLCEFHERNWTWLDLSLAIKQRCKRVLVQQFMRQKLLRNRLMTGGPEIVEGVSEEEKKRIALGTTSAIEKKKKK